MLRCSSLSVIAASFLRSVSMSAPFLPMITPGRAVWIVTRHFLCGRSMMMRRHAGLRAFLLDEVTDLDVFQQEIAVILGVGVPAAVPGPVDLKPHADRIDLLTHYACSPAASTWRTLMVISENGFMILP